MKFVEVLCEGSSDVPALRAVLERRFQLVEEQSFRIHPHRGKGKLPGDEHLLRKPGPRDETLLGQLPIKLKNLGRQSNDVYEIVVLVVVDADDDNPAELLASLNRMLSNLPTRPRCCIFGVAVEETESWFIADLQALKAAYSHAKTGDLKKIKKDAVCGAWEALARALGLDPSRCGGHEKTEWATEIAPHLNVLRPVSPSLKALIENLEPALL